MYNPKLDKEVAILGNYDKACKNGRVNAVKLNFERYALIVPVPDDDGSFDVVGRMYKCGFSLESPVDYRFLWYQDKNGPIQDDGFVLRLDMNKDGEILRRRKLPLSLFDRLTVHVETGGPVNVVRFTLG